MVGRQSAVPLASKRMAVAAAKGNTTATSPENYRADPMYPRVERAVLAILVAHTVVAPVDVFIHMGLLQAKDLESWRFGRIPFLERVILGNLSKLRRLLRILGYLCHDLNLRASGTAYVRWGKGPRVALRFTKTGAVKLESIYARHFVWPGKGPFHLPMSRRDPTLEVHVP